MVSEYRYRTLPGWAVAGLAVAGLGVGYYLFMYRSPALGVAWAFLVLGLGLPALKYSGLAVEHVYRAAPEGLTVHIAGPGQAPVDQLLPWSQVTDIDYVVETETQRSRRTSLVVRTDQGPPLRIAGHGPDFWDLVAAVQQFLPQLDYAWVQGPMGFQKVQKGEELAATLRGATPAARFQVGCAWFVAISLVAAAAMTGVVALVLWAAGPFSGPFGMLAVAVPAVGALLFGLAGVQYLLWARRGWHRPPDQ